MTISDVSEIIKIASGIFMPVALYYFNSINQTLKELKDKVSELEKVQVKHEVLLETNK